MDRTVGLGARRNCEVRCGGQFFYPNYMAPIPAMCFVPISVQFSQSRIIGAPKCYMYSSKEKGGVGSVRLLCGNTVLLRYFYQFVNGI